MRRAPSPTDYVRMCERARLAAAALVAEQEALIAARRQQVAAERRARIAEVGGIVADAARLILDDLNPDDTETIHARREALLAEVWDRAREDAA